jgi:hypothetical protein
MDFEIIRRSPNNGIWQDAGTVKAESVEAALRPLEALPGDVLVLEAPGITDDRLFFDVYWSASGHLAVR